MDCSNKTIMPVVWSIFAMTRKRIDRVLLTEGRLKRRRRASRYWTRLVVMSCRNNSIIQILISTRRLYQRPSFSYLVLSAKPIKFISLGCL